MGYYNNKKVLSVVSVEYLAPRGNIKLTENGSYDIRAYQKAVVSVFPSGTIQAITDESVGQFAGAFENILPNGSINYVGGKSYVMNQSVYNQSGTTTLSGGEAYKVFTGSEKYNAGHKVLVSCQLDFTNAPSATRALHINGNDGTGGHGNYINENIGLSADNAARRIFSIQYDNTQFSFIAVTATSFGAGESFVFTKARAIDLTQMFGAGNEPTSIDDHRILWLLSQDTPYTEGELWHAPVTNLQSTDGTDTTNYPIPAEVRALDGYGMGINDTLYNYIDFERKKFVKKVGIVDLGTLEWFYQAQEPKFFYANVQLDIKPIESTSTKANMLCTKYQIVPQSRWSTNDKSICQTTNNQGKQLLVNDTSFTSQSDFREAMSGQYLLYELETPIEINISEYLDTTFTNENLITLYEDGKVYFENQYNIEVPYSLTYQERII